jgi:short subunit fatty acids transporter
MPLIKQGIWVDHIEVVTVFIHGGSVWITSPEFYATDVEDAVSQALGLACENHQGAHVVGILVNPTSDERRALEDSAEALLIASEAK